MQDVAKNRTGKFSESKAKRGNVENGGRQRQGKGQGQGQGQGQGTATYTCVYCTQCTHMWQLNRRRQHVLQVIYFYVFVGGRQNKKKSGKEKIK